MTLLRAKVASVTDAVSIVTANPACTLI